MNHKSLDDFWKNTLMDQYKALILFEKSENWVINSNKLFKKALFFAQKDRVIEISYMRNNIVNFIMILNYLPMSKAGYILHEMEKYNSGILLSILTILKTNSSLEDNQGYVFKNRLKTMLNIGIFNNVCPIHIKELIQELI